MSNRLMLGNITWKTAHAVPHGTKTALCGKTMDIVQHREWTNQAAHQYVGTDNQYHRMNHCGRCLKAAQS